MGKEEYSQLPKEDDNGANQPQQEQIAANVGLGHRIIHALDMLDLTGIFVMNGFDFMKLIFEHLARYIMLPIAAASTIVMSILSWVEYGLSKDKDVKGFLLGKAITETIGAGAVNAAVIGSLVSASFFVGPYLFAGYLGYKALYHFGAAIFFSHKAYKAHKSGDKKQYEKFKGKMIDTWTGFVVGALATATVITVIIFLQSAFWVMGAVAVGLGAAYTIFRIAEHIYKKMNPPRQPKPVNLNNDPVLDLNNPEHQPKNGNNSVQNQAALERADDQRDELSSSSGDESDLLDQSKTPATTEQSGHSDANPNESSSSSDDEDYLKKSHVGIPTADSGTIDTNAGFSNIGLFGDSPTSVMTANNDDATQSLFNHAKSLATPNH